MTQYAEIQAILQEAVENNDVGSPHGAFWKQTRNQFVATQVLGCPILHKENGKYVGPQSLLVKILKGSLQDCKNKARPQMPYGYNPVSADKIQKISDWIDDQCPE